MTLGSPGVTHGICSRGGGHHPSDFSGRFTQPAPAYSGTFIPEIWSGKLIEKFYATTVLAAISNTDYEGEIRNQGDKVHIRTKPTITIRDYLIGGQLAVDRPASNIVDLKIDKGKYFNEILDDVHGGPVRHQSDGHLVGRRRPADEDHDRRRRAAGHPRQGRRQEPGPHRRQDHRQHQSRCDRHAARRVVGNIANPPVAGQVTVLQAILRLGQALDEQNIPEQGRWIVMPTWAATMIKTVRTASGVLVG